MDHHVKSFVNYLTIKNKCVYTTIDLSVELLQKIAVRLQKPLGHVPHAFNFLYRYLDHGSDID